MKKHLISQENLQHSQAAPTMDDCRSVNDRILDTALLVATTIGAAVVLIFLILL